MLKKSINKNIPGACDTHNDLYLAVWGCDDSHRLVLQQRAVVHDSSPVQDVPERRGSRGALSPAELWASRHSDVFLQRTVGLKAPVEQNMHTHRLFSSIYDLFMLKYEIIMLTGLPSLVNQQILYADHLHSALLFNDFKFTDCNVVFFTLVTLLVSFLLQQASV